MAQSNQYQDKFEQLRNDISKAKEALAEARKFAKMAKRNIKNRKGEIRNAKRFLRIAKTQDAIRRRTGFNEIDATLTTSGLRKIVRKIEVM